MANWYVSSVAYASVAQFAINTAYTLGQYVRQLAAPAFGSERVFKCTTAGTSAATEPTWNLTDGATTTSGTATFTQVAGRETEQLAGNWRAPLATAQAAVTVLGATAATFFVSNDHTDTQAATYLIGASSLQQWFSVSRTGASLPPTSTDYLTGATIQTSGANTLTIRGITFMKGVTLKAGSGSSNASLTLTDSSGGAAPAQVSLEDCSLVLNTTSASARFVFQPAGFSESYVTLVNTTLTFGATGQSITFGGSAVTAPFHFVWRDTPAALAGSVPTNLFNTWTPASARIAACDFSTLNGNFWTAGITALGRSSILDCQLHASTLFPGLATTPALPQGSFIAVDNCDSASGGLNYKFTHFNSGGIVITSDTVVVRTGGASDGVASYSHKYRQAGTTTPTFAAPAWGDWMTHRYKTTGAAKTVTINIIAFTASLPTSVNTWLETQALETAGAPLGTGHTTRTAVSTDAGTGLTTTTDDWTAGSVAARQNTHVYVAGDFIKLASNPGRVFICTTGGTSAGSEPGGYATAVDGGSVTDNTAVFRAGWRCKLTQSITPQMQGAVRCRVQSALASGAVFFVDPLLAIA
jgi:hypothetical protein